MRSQKPSDSFDVNTIPILRAVCGGVRRGDVLTCYLKKSLVDLSTVHSTLMFKKITVNSQFKTGTILGNTSKK